VTGVSNGNDNHFVVDNVKNYDIAKYLEFRPTIASVGGEGFHIWKLKCSRQSNGESLFQIVQETISKIWNFTIEILTSRSNFEFGLG